MELVQAHTGTEQRLDRLTASVDQLRPGSISWRPRSISWRSGRTVSSLLDDDHAQAVRLAGVVVRGRRDGAVVYLVVEASAVVRLEEVKRAHERAGFLRRTGVTAVPVVAGPSIAIEPPSFADELGVWQVSNGRVIPPSAAA